MKRTVVLIITLSVILNSFALLRGIELPDNGALENAVAVEFTVLSFLSVSSLPFRMLDNIMGAGGLSPGTKQGSPAKQEKKRAKNNVSDCSINCFETNLKVPEYRNGISGASPAYHFNPVSPARSGYWSHLIRGMTVFTCLFLLAYLVRLSRSNLPGEQALFLSFFDPILFRGIGFFFWKGNNAY